MNARDKELATFRPNLTFPLMKMVLKIHKNVGQFPYTLKRARVSRC